MSLEDIKTYLPKYLTPESEESLFEELKQFPLNIDSRIYTTHLIDANIIYQGDGIDGLLVINLPDTTIRKAPSVVISNTCDINPANKGLYDANLCYCPILNLNKYREKLLAGHIEESVVDNHIGAIKQQRVTQIFYLPKGGLLKEDSFACLDKIISCINNIIPQDKLRDYRIFTLSNLGLYLFIFKLSIHLTRVTEKVDRNNLSFLPPN